MLIMASICPSSNSLVNAGPATCCRLVSFTMSILKASIIAALAHLNEPAPVEKVPNFLPRRSAGVLYGESLRTMTFCTTVSPPPDE